MIDHLKILPATAIEVATNNPHNLDLELIGIENLSNCDIFKDSIRSGDINLDSTLRHLVGLNNNFFYSVECISNNNRCSVTNGCTYERGIGYLYEQNNSLFLKRLLPIVNQYADNITQQNAKEPRPFKCCESDSTVIVTCIVPPTYLEALAVPHSFIMSGYYPFIPTPVQVQENSFLGRLKESIQNIAFDSFDFVNFVVNALCKFKTQIKLKTSKLTVNRIETNLIDIKATTDQKAVKGSLCYDELTNKLKFYNGNDWKTVVFED